MVLIPLQNDKPKSIIYAKVSHLSQSVLYARIQHVLWQASASFILKCKTTPSCSLHPSLPSIWIRHPTEMHCNSCLKTTLFHLSSEAHLEFPLQGKQGMGCRKKVAVNVPVLLWCGLKIYLGNLDSEMLLATILDTFVNQSHLINTSYCGQDNCARAQGLSLPLASAACSALNPFLFFWGFTWLQGELVWQNYLS